MQQDTALTAPHADAHAVGHAAHAGHDAAAHNENLKFAYWLFLSSESMLFTVLIICYVFVRFNPEHGAEHAILNIPQTSLSTFILLTSSFLVVRALDAAKNGLIVKLQRSLALTVLMGAAFLGLQYLEYSHMGHEGVTLSSGPFGMAFFSLTGFHGFHVIIGVIWCFVLFNQSLAGKFSKERNIGIELFGLYWHFVDVVWIFIFTIVYLL
jgi:heme/copper-type cytochrome/quinol oxidase subunit 3